MENLFSTISVENLVAALQVAGLGMAVVVSIMTTISLGIWGSGRISVAAESYTKNRRHNRVSDGRTLEGNAT